MLALHSEKVSDVCPISCKDLERVVHCALNVATFETSNREV